ARLVLVVIPVDPDPSGVTQASGARDVTHINLNFARIFRYLRVIADTDKIDGLYELTSLKGVNSSTMPRNRPYGGWKRVDGCPDKDILSTYGQGDVDAIPPTRKSTDA